MCFSKQQKNERGHFRQSYRARDLNNGVLAFSSLHFSSLYKYLSTHPAILPVLQQGQTDYKRSCVMQAEVGRDTEQLWVDNCQVIKRWLPGGTEGDLCHRQAIKKPTCLTLNECRRPGNFFPWPFFSPHFEERKGYDLSDEEFAEGNLVPFACAWMLPVYSRCWVKFWFRSV